MIRIDLGKDELQKVPSKGKGLKINAQGITQFLSKLKGKGKKAKRSGGGGRPGFSADVPGALLIVIGVALAFLPHLFFSQYKTFIIAQNAQRMKVLQEKTDVVNQEITRLQPFRKELESYEQQKKLVKDRLGVVRDLLTSRGTPVNVLDALGQSLPERTWIARLKLDLEGQKAKLEIAGDSYSNEDISDFVDKLSESVYFNEVVLDDVVPGKGEGKVDIRSFSLHAKPKVKLLAFTKTTPVAPFAPPPNPVAKAPRPGQGNRPDTGEN